MQPASPGRSGTPDVSYSLWPGMGGHGQLARQGRQAAERTAALDTLVDLLRLSSVERLLGVARLLAALVLLASLELGTGPYHPPAVKLLMSAYVAYTAVVLLVVWRRDTAGGRGALALHVLDFAWAGWATSISGGTSSMVFPLFAFILAAGAYRWGLARTLLDGAVVLTIAFVQAAASLAGQTPWPFEADWFILRVSSIAILAVLFGTLAERQHESHAHAAAVGHLMVRVGRANGIRGAIREMLDELLRVFGARRALLIVQEFDGSRLYLWQADPRPGAAAVVSHLELKPHDCDAWFFPAGPGVATMELRRPGGDTVEVVTAQDASGRRVAPATAVSADLAIPGGWRSAVVAVVDGKRSLQARLFLVDPMRPRRGDARLALLQSLLREAAPVVANLYLLRRLRSTAGWRERERLSRELHDGVIQTLAALEMRLEVLRAAAEASDPALAAEATSAREVLHDEALKTRELMERLRQVDTDAQRLPGQLADLVGRFSRATGIEARLDCAVDRVELPPRECQEVLRIVQEALVNIRRHSGASRAVVRLEVDAYDWGLIIQDNGRGLGFTGRLGRDQIERDPGGPRVIRERASALGGTFALESAPTGLRLEITWPRLPRD